METHWSVWLGIAGGIAAAALSVTRLVLHGFSGGRLRKLQETTTTLFRILYLF